MSTEETMSEACEGIALQDQYAPRLQCFGCGPANEKGLRIKSYPRGAELVATFRPDAHHHAYPGMLNGGIIGTLLDCHCNWAAAWFLMQERQSEAPPCTVTAEYSIRLLRPTPTDGLLTLSAHRQDSKGDRVWVEGNLTSEDGKVCATCVGLFVAVKEGHPAYHRW